MPYPEMLVAPMRAELTNVGFTELKTPEDVEKVLNEKDGTALVVFNSVCGCAAGTARPGVIKSVAGDKKPAKLYTVFAGQDVEAVAKAREFTAPFPPSSPSIALFKNGELVHFIERHMIEGRPADMIAASLQSAYAEYC
ncbi:MAG: BrxA/BrxB family bacilliredoxin [Bacteroidia bacterium]|jgi:putative YphP/YqiW family bacilliredoxin|nr:BrxA/BrxB family bacilliredoxin [Bacteroidia bacterium]MBP7260855.1 BrxA/BrxB family bacilliredoxin [Bacteroidia bacterium]MBP9179068.1 BrxA/BrxB family bacilliredoxin [Bacteroidia bacterium]MBP9725076.1 BrxA/BrxB family bacilliredoxin [Bacteroidia bacterium]